MSFYIDFEIDNFSSLLMTNMTTCQWIWKTNVIQTITVIIFLYRFSAFWLRSKCSICSYQLNIWYEDQVFSSILNWFLNGDGIPMLALILSIVILELQYLKVWRTAPIVIIKSFNNLTCVIDHLSNTTNNSES